MNLLSGENSPYLRQHANNPVNWVPWSDTALQSARDQNKPIFISIGYSTCHWCHVMARESFSDDQVAQCLNSHFVCIKVDREERPDIDASYMQACQSLIGHDGWPLNLFLTPAGHPFYALTYLPKSTANRQTGFLPLTEKIAELWQTHPDNILRAAEQLVHTLNKVAKPEQEEIRTMILSSAADNLKQLYDSRYGGFGQAPKFPQPHILTLLLRLQSRFKDPELLQMALHTLSRISRGGISDQLGGGIHRYAVDGGWLIPHFEKMLYDQALITEAYLYAWAQCGSHEYRNAAEAVLDYCLTRLQHETGGFCCGEDADTEGEEGSFYSWTYSELHELLQTDFPLFKKIYQLSPHGNFSGANILSQAGSVSSVAQECDLTEQQVTERLNGMRCKLLRARAKRARPQLDDKLIAGWNGLMICTLAKAGGLLNRDDYLAAARRAWTFITDEMTADKRLKRCYCRGEAYIEAFHEDYAYLIHGTLALFHATAEPHYLARAIHLQGVLDETFVNSDTSFSDSSQPFLQGMPREQNRQDGALPAANSITILNLIHLARLCDRPDWQEKAEHRLKVTIDQIEEYPTAFACLLQGVDRYLQDRLFLALILPDGAEIDSDWLGLLIQEQHRLLHVVTDRPQELEDLIPMMVEKSAINGRTTAWLCTGQECFEPVQSPEQLKRLLATVV